MIEQAMDRLYKISSEKRLESFLYEFEIQESGETFWPVFTEMWTICDATWEHRSDVCTLLRRHADTRATYDRREREQTFFRSLPERLTVYRGCSRMRQRGVSWTTDREVAAGFAKGHRGIRVPDPVIVECSVSKNIVLATFAYEREESEVLLDYRRLPRVLHQTMGDTLND